MKLAHVLRVAATALATGAMLASGLAPAHAAENYPPKVSALYASPIVSRGYAAVGLSGERLGSGMTIRATRGSRVTVAKVSVNSTGTTATALVKVGKLVSKFAGRYPIAFQLQGGSVQGELNTTQTFTVGRAISIKGLSVVRKPYGLLITGTAVKKTPVRIKVKYGSTTFSTKVRGGAHFAYKFKKKSRTFTVNGSGGFTVTAQVAPNKKYFSAPVSTTYYLS